MNQPKIRALPKIVGILNLSPESFSGDGIFEKEKAIDRASQMISEGADVIDVGAQSTRPHSVQLSVEEECRRVKGIIKAIKDKFPHIQVSIDTTRYEVASLAIEEGADMVNDISGGRFDERLIPSLVDSKVKYVLTHSQGLFSELHATYRYQNIIHDLIKYFDQRLNYCKQVGWSREQIRDRILLDPGIGFSKSYKDNIVILNHMEKFTYLFPNNLLYIGISRKGFIGRLTEEENPDDPVQRDNATTALHMLCIQRRAYYIRTHNVKNLYECKQVLDVFDE